MASCNYLTKSIILFVSFFMSMSYSDTSEFEIKDKKCLSAIEQYTDIYNKKLMLKGDDGKTVYEIKNIIDSQSGNLTGLRGNKNMNRDVQNIVGFKADKIIVDQATRDKLTKDEEVLIPRIQRLKLINRFLKQLPPEQIEELSAIVNPSDREKQIFQTIYNKCQEEKVCYENLSFGYLSNESNYIKAFGNLLDAGADISNQLEQWDKALSFNLELNHKQVQIQKPDSWSPKKNEDISDKVISIAKDIENKENEIKSIKQSDLYSFYSDVEQLKIVNVGHHCQKHIEQAQNITNISADCYPRSHPFKEVIKLAHLLSDTTIPSEQTLKSRIQRNCYEKKHSDALKYYSYYKEHCPKKLKHIAGTPKKLDLKREAIIKDEYGQSRLMSSDIPRGTWSRAFSLAIVPTLFMYNDYLYTKDYADYMVEAGFEEKEWRLADFLTSEYFGSGSSYYWGHYYDPHFTYTGFQF